MCSIENNLKMVRVVSIVAACVRKSVMNVQTCFLRLFVACMPLSEAAMGVEWIVLW